MLSADVLRRLAAKEVIQIFGKRYLRENHKDICFSYGIIKPDKYLFFIGIKSTADLPERKATEDGWVVYALVHLDAYTGEIVKREYELE